MAVIKTEKRKDFTLTFKYYLRDKRHILLSLQSCHIRYMKFLSYFRISSYRFPVSSSI